MFVYQIPECSYHCLTSNSFVIHVQLYVNMDRYFINGNGTHKQLNHPFAKPHSICHIYYTHLLICFNYIHNMFLFISCHLYYGRWFTSFVHVAIIEIEKSMLLLQDRGAHTGGVHPPRRFFFRRKVQIYFNR